jgi:hypothetical protein
VTVPEVVFAIPGIVVRRAFTVRKTPAQETASREPERPTFSCVGSVAGGGVNRAD